VSGRGRSPMMPFSTQHRSHRRVVMPPAGGYNPTGIGSNTLMEYYDFVALPLGAPRMRERKRDTGLFSLSDLANLDFVKYLRREFPDDRVRPDDQDFDLSAEVTTDEQASEQYRLADARKVIRMYREWKAAQN
jgi:hypothetical protein